jgi:hypothetical protein
MPEGIVYPLEQLAEGIGNLSRHLLDDCPITQRSNLLTISMKDLEAKTNKKYRSN